MRSFAAPLFNFLIIAVGIHQFGKVLWGEVISIQIAIFLVVFLANWGNKEYLLRQYSNQPARMDGEFYSSIITRGVVLIGGGLFYLFFHPMVATLMLVWMILQFVYTSSESLVVYHQKFKSQLLAEVLGAAVLLVFLLAKSEFDIRLLLTGFVLSFLVKNLVVYSSIKPSWGGSIGWNKQHFVLALPFFLIGLSGWLQSKVDLYVVDYFLSNSKLSEYQLLLSMFLMLQSASALLIAPFTKHIYRVENNALSKMKIGLMLAGIPVVLAGTLGVYMVLEWGMDMNLDTMYYGYGAIFTLPSFFYLMDIMILYRNKQEKSVLMVNLVGAILNFIITIVFIQSIGIEGALIGIVAAQWGMLILFKFWKKNHAN